MGFTIKHVIKPKVIPRTKLKPKAREITDILVSGQFEGKSCVIVGGGPSLSGFTPSKLDDVFVIGVNKAFMQFPCNINFAMDDTFYNLVRQDLRTSTEQTKLYHAWTNFEGIKLFLRLNTKYAFDSDVCWVKPLGFAAISYCLDQGIYPANNSAFAATMLAISLGFKHIGLLGVDLCFLENDRRTHWHAGYEGQTTQSLLKKFKEFKKVWESFAPAFKEDGINICNLNPWSALKCFPQVSSDDFIRDMK